MPNRSKPRNNSNYKNEEGQNIISKIINGFKRFIDDFMLVLNCREVAKEIRKDQMKAHANRAAANEERKVANTILRRMETAKEQARLEVYELIEKGKAEKSRLIEEGEAEKSRLIEEGEAEKSRRIEEGKRYAAARAVGDEISGSIAAALAKEKPSDGKSRVVLDGGVVQASGKPNEAPLSPCR